MTTAWLLVDSKYCHRDAWGRSALFLSAVFVGFSLLCHLANGMIIPFVLLLLFLKKRIKFTEAILGGLIAAFLVGTWYIPKKIYETPHPSLFRYLFANAQDKEIFFGSTSDMQAIIDSYKNMSWNDVYLQKKSLFLRSLPPATLSRNSLISNNYLFLVPGIALLAAALIGCCRFSSLPAEQRHRQGKAALFFLGTFIASYVFLLIGSFCFAPYPTLFPTGILFFYILAFLLAAAWANEKFLLVAMYVSILLWAIWFLDFYPWGAAVFVLTIGILCFWGMKAKYLSSPG